MKLKFPNKTVHSTHHITQVPVPTSRTRLVLQHTHSLFVTSLSSLTYGVCVCVSAVFLHCTNARPYTRSSHSSHSHTYTARYGVVRLLQNIQSNCLFEILLTTKCSTLLHVAVYPTYTYFFARKFHFVAKCINNNVYNRLLLGHRASQLIWMDVVKLPYNTLAPHSQLTKHQMQNTHTTQQVD